MKIKNNFSKNDKILKKEIEKLDKNACYCFGTDIDGNDYIKTAKKGNCDFSCR